MIIGGLDIARFTGIALTDPRVDPARWRTFCLALDKDKTWVKTATFSHSLRAFFQDADHHADFMVIEMPLGIVIDYADASAAADGGKRTINATTVVALASMAGAAMAVLDGLGIPYGMLQPRSWHAAYFGPGFNPPVKTVKQNGKSRIEKDWKAASVARARQQGIPLPIGNRQAQEDCADAVGAACAWTSKALFVPAHHHAAYMQLRMTSGRIAA